MKKTLALLMLAAMLLSTGCGNNAMDGAKKDAQEAAQKVEQKANEAKDAANQTADDAAKKADEMKSDAAAKADEMKSDAEAKVDEMKSDAADMANEAVDKLDAMAGNMAGEISGRTIALSGVMPGASLDDLTAMFGEPTATNGNVLTFVDGLMVTLDDAKKTVKSISTTGSDFDTPEGMYVGAYEYSLNEYCGPADSIRKIDGGAEYEYDSGDKKSKVVYKAQNGYITEITCSLK